MTIHHWLPKSQGGTIQETFTICKTCHEFLHYYIPIEEVSSYKTPQSLEKHYEFSLYLQWVREKNTPNYFKIKKVIDQIANHALVA